MPTFCRHNHLVQNCPICSREQQVELRPVVSPGGPRTAQPRSGAAASQLAADQTGLRSGSRARGSASRSGAGLTVRKLERGADDGYRSALAPGLKSGADAERLAQELAFAVARLAQLSVAPQGLYAEVADPAGDLEERTWLAFLIAYLGPLNGEAPFAGIEAARTSWSSGEPPRLQAALVGPRGAYEPDRDRRTANAYRAWAARGGSQAASIGGEAAWTPERRFARAFERLALPGLHRGARFDLLTTLGRLGVYELSAGALQFASSDPVTLAAKRILGIGDPMLLERRAADLALACQVPVEALDVGLYNWGQSSRATLGAAAETEPDSAVVDSARTALRL